MPKLAKIEFSETLNDHAGDKEFWVHVDGFALLCVRKAYDGDQWYSTGLETYRTETNSLLAKYPGLWGGPWGEDFGSTIAGAKKEIRAAIRCRTKFNTEIS